MLGIGQSSRNPEPRQGAFQKARSEAFQERRGPLGPHGPDRGILEHLWSVQDHADLRGWHAPVSAAVSQNL